MQNSFTCALAGAFKLLQETGVEFNVLAVVNELTARHAGTIYNYFRSLGLRHMQFIPCVEADPQTHVPYPFSVGPEAYADFLCELFDTWLADPATANPAATTAQEAGDCVSIRLFDGLLQKELCGNSGLCYLDGDCGTCPVVEYNGDVYPCDFFVQPEQKLGNICATPLERIVMRSKARRFRSSRHKLPQECDDCEWRTLCRGGCLKDRQRISGGFDVPTYFCRTYKRFLAHAAGPIKRLAARLRKAQTV